MIQGRLRRREGSGRWQARRLWPAQYPGSGDSIVRWRGVISCEMTALSAFRATFGSWSAAMFTHEAVRWTLTAKT